MTVTIKDVALKAGVSPSTVSRVIAGSGRISAGTIERVRHAMTALGYHPNRTAQSLVKRTTDTIGIVLPRPADELFLNTFFPELIRGIVARAARAGYDILMTAGTTEQEEVEAMQRMVRSRRVDGMIVLRSRLGDPIIRLLEEERFPYVLIGRNGDMTNTLSVDTDNVKASYDATTHLIAQGHQWIGFVSGPSNLMVSRDRLEGYHKAMTDAGLTVRQDWIVEGEFLQESGYRAMSYIMGLPHPPTALVIIDDVVAFGVMRGLTELGYRIPEDLCLVSFNNIPLAELASPPLTSVDIGIYQLGYTASQLLLEYMTTGTPSIHRHIVPHRLIVRESSIGAEIEPSPASSRTL